MLTGTLTHISLRYFIRIMAITISCKSILIKGKALEDGVRSFICELDICSPAIYI